MSLADADPKGSPAGPIVRNDCRKVGRVLTRVGDKWSVLVVMLLVARSSRFNELKREIGGISQRMLTLTLRGLERDGLVWRSVHATVSPRVEYGLTPLGRSLAAPVRALGEWARSHADEIETAQARYEAAQGRTAAEDVAG